MNKYLLFIWAILFSTNVFSQNSCQPNIDFELGNLSYWHYYTGSCCPISTPTSTNPVTNRHTLTSGTSNDPYGGFPIVAPNGGSYSLRLGNDSIGAQAEKARYYVHVPAGVSNYDLIYRYAVVLQNPNHTSAQQPRFEIEVYDSATNASMPCNTFTYVASGSLPGFTQSSVGSSVFYKPWTTGVINLSGYGGHTVIIDFASGDCSLGGHFGYGYLDMTCGLFQISTVQCNLSGYTTLNAPPGFQSYVWKDSTFTNTVATGQTVSIPTPSVSTSYKLILTPYTGYGCPDTLSTRIVISNLAINSSNDTAICVNSSVQLYSGVSGGIAPFTYSWTPTTGLSCSNCANPVATPTANTTYHVTVMDSSGCSRGDSIVVTFKPTPVLSSSLSPASVCSGTLFNYGPTSATPNTSFTWTRASVAGISNPSSSGAGSINDTLINTTPNNVNVTYAYVLNALGCTDTQNVVVGIKPTPILSSSLNPAAICNNTAFNYIPTSATSGATYSWSRAAVSGIANVGASGTGSIGEILIDSTNTTVNANYVLTLSANGCTHTQSITETVKPTPLLTSSLNPNAICSFTGFAYAPSSSVQGTTFNWSRLAVPGISNIAANGTGNVFDTLINTTPTLVSTYYIYTLNAAGCMDTQTVVVSVKPTPLLSSTLSPASVCNGNVFSYVPTSATSSTSFSWTRAAVTGISNAAGSGTGSIGEVLLNSTNSNVNVNYEFALNASGCGNSQSMTVTVKPSPALTSTLNPPSFCSGSIFNYVPLSTIPGTTFSWSRSAINGISNPASYGSPNIFESLINTTSANVNAIYTYVLTAYGCSDTENVTVPVKIYPQSPSVSTSNLICEHDTIVMSASCGNTGATYVWGGPNSYSSNLQNPQLSNVQTNISGVYSVIINLSGCSDTLYLPVTVHTLLGPPSVSIAVSPNDTVCGGTLLSFASSFTNAGNPGYQWTKNGIDIPGANNAIYTSSAIANGDVMGVKIISSSICQPVNTASSNTIKEYVIIIPPPAINLTLYPVQYKQGDTVTFTGHVPQGVSNLSYRWMKNGVFINGATTSTYTSSNLKMGDSICFVVYSSVLCTIPDSSIACWQLGATTGVESISMKEGLNIWPNPVNNQLNIENAEIGALVRVYNALGQQIYSGVINSNKEHINTSTFSKGVYLLEFVGSEGYKETRRFVKE